jgi:predicted MFS family arabinose efflux permease
VAIDAPAVPVATYRSVFGHAEFRVIFGATVLYGLGFQFEILGLSVLVYAQTRSPLLSALAFGIGFLPQVAGGALLTSLADRLRPRTAITAGLLVRAAPGLAIGLIPGLPIAAMLAIVGVAATVAPVFTAAAAGLLPDFFSGDSYVLARSIFGVTSSGTQLLGLGIGGGVLALLPARQLLLAAGAALTLAAVIVRLGLRRHAARAVSGGHGILRATIAGNAELLADRRIRNLLLAQWLPAWFVTGAESLIVPYVGSLHRPPSAASALLAALPIGMLVSDLVIGRFCRPALRNRLVFPLVALMGLPLLVFAGHPPLAVAGGLLGLAGTGFGYALGIQQAFLDSLPQELRGQAFGLNATGLMGGQGLSPPVAGALAGAVGVGAAMAAAGAATLVAAVALRRTLTGRGDMARP